MIRRLLLSGNEGKIAHALGKIHPADLSILFSEVSANESQKLIDALCSIEIAGKTIRELPEFIIPDILELIDDNKLTLIISRQEPDDALFLLEKVPESRWRIILEKLPGPQRKELDKLLLYPKNSAGSAMTSNIITLKADMTVEEAIESLRNKPETEGIFYIYVVDDGGCLVGVQSLRSLVMAAKDKKIRDIMIHDVHSVLATTPQEGAAQIVGQYNLLALPVVNENRELLGVITVDDVIDIVKEEATEDIYHLVGLSGVDRAVTPVKIKVKKRLPWMIINLATATLAATVVGFFQKSIEQFVALAVFMPIVAGVGGNGAHQSLTVIVRSIALGELAFVRVYKAIFREVANGLILGLICGSVMGIVSYFWKGNIYLGIVLFIAMTLNLVMGGLMGATIPIIFKMLKQDPALGTSVFVSMFTDVLGFFFFLGIATLMLNYLV